VSVCAYCGTVLTKPTRYWVGPRAHTRDHIKPRCDGGRLKVDACFRCNGDKGDLYLDEWIAKLRASGDRRLKNVEAFAEKHPTIRFRPAWSRRGGALPDENAKPHYCSFCNRRFGSEYSALQHARAIRHSPVAEECIEAIVPMAELL
jgi:hypothetical protein